MAGMYAVYHGPKGVTRIATRIHALATAFAQAIKQAGLAVVHEQFFDTVLVNTAEQTEQIYQNALNVGYNLRKVDDNHLAIAFSETSDAQDFGVLTQLFTGVAAELSHDISLSLSPTLLRTDAILSHNVFNSHHTEHEMLRYLKKLENKDLAMNHSMISMGSCFMEAQRHQ